MNEVFWLFCTFLIVLTLIASVGGGIRFRENFIDEVFDKVALNANTSDTDVVSNSMLKKLTFDNMKVGYDPAQQTNASLNVQNEQVSELQDVQDETETETGSFLENVPPPTMQTNVIEAFDGDMFASF